jgi:CheY-like chemotaxis protein
MMGCARKEVQDMKKTRLSVGRLSGSCRFAGIQERAGLRVLIAEGHADNAQTTALLLRLFGHEAQIAADGPSALQAAEAAPFDVVLLEIVLPRMNGWEVAKRLREGRRGKSPFLIAVTGLGREEDRRRSVEAGIDLHLVKPADPQALQNVLEQLRFEIQGLAKGGGRGAPGPLPWGVPA